MVEKVSDVTPIKRKLGVPESLWSCHTAMVAGYAVEGHVPADLVQRVLAERPAVAGLAAPGMPNGSPGMEGASKESYEIVAFTAAGTRRCTRCASVARWTHLASRIAEELR
jgi:hypothetical protein